jgi:hypothetical protein
MTDSLWHGYDDIACVLGIFSIRRDFLTSLYLSSNLIDTNHNSAEHKLQNESDGQQEYIGIIK